MVVVCDQRAASDGRHSRKVSGGWDWASWHAAFEGKDEQLEAAIRYLQQRIREKPIEPPHAPKYPDKSFQPGGGGTATGGRVR